MSPYLARRIISNCSSSNEWSPTSTYRSPIHGSPTIREEDGLALSSRNAYLSEDERQRAPELNRSLEACRALLRQGIDEDKALAEAVSRVEGAGFRPDYFALRDAHTLGPVTDRHAARLLAAAWLGKTRLIDNIAV
jgi:pantoate--beta-alanine ligase